MFIQAKEILSLVFDFYLLSMRVSLTYFLSLSKFKIYKYFKY